MDDKKLMIDYLRRSYELLEYAYWVIPYRSPRLRARLRGIKERLARLIHGLEEGEL